MNSHTLMGGAITDVAGVQVGHAAMEGRPTGCTVVLTSDGAVAGVDVRGAAPGTRETDLLDPGNLVERIHAVLLSGGSAFGLDAAAGVVRWLEGRGVGHEAGPVRVPIVPAAILFDLHLGNPAIRPDAACGYRACEAASAAAPLQGCVGAGAGATVGKFFGVGRAMRGGIGTASLRVGGFTVGAIVAVNAMGDVIDPATGRIIAGARDASGGRFVHTTRALLADAPSPWTEPAQATTIGVVATDAQLTKAQARKLAQMSHDGLARTIDPIHTLFDGDTMFALATGVSGREGDPVLLGIAAAAVTAAAVLNAVTHAQTLHEPGLPVLPCALEMTGLA